MISSLPKPMTEADCEALGVQPLYVELCTRISHEQWRRDMVVFKAWLRERGNVWCALAADDIDAALMAEEAT